MIKKLLFLVSLCAHILVNGQSYKRMLIQDTTTWQHYGYYLGAKNNTNYLEPLNNSIAALDTITVSGQLYRKLYHLTTPSLLNYANKSLLGYLREDSIAKKVYFKETGANPEFVLYNFSLNVGDSTLLTFPNFNGYSGFYRVDSIATRNEVCGPRRHLYLRKHQNNQDSTYYYYEWIESIGCSYHLLYTYSSYMMGQDIIIQNGCRAKWMYGLACKHNDDTLEYKSCTSLYPNFWGMNYLNQCTYYFFTWGLQNQQFLRELSVYPSPSKDKLTVTLQSESAQNIELKIQDLSGRTIIHQKNVSLNEGENKREINLSTLQPGAYSLIIEAGNTKSSRIIMIEP